MRSTSGLRAATAVMVALCIAASCTGTHDQRARRSAPVVPADGPAGLPDPVRSPPVDPDAPYTPMVRSLIDQLLPTDPPTVEQVINASLLFQGFDTRSVDGVGSCNTVGLIKAPTGTNPSISPMCWADSVGIDVTSGPNKQGATAPPLPLALAASFNRQLNNAWGQVEGVEGRSLMVTGLYGPEVDVAVQPNWQRVLDTFGEDPFLTSQLASEQVHGMQGQGLMAQVKHLAGFSGARRLALTEVQDQALHEIFLPSFEATLGGDAKAAAVMCAYNGLHNPSEHLPPNAPVLFAPSPWGGDASTTWPLDEPHWSCEQPLTLNYLLRQLWGSVAIVGSDYPATYSTSAALQGLTQEFPFAIFLGLGWGPDGPPASIIAGPPSNPSGSTCAIEQRAVPCDEPGARHVSGIPGPNCPEPNGCGFGLAVLKGLISMPLFKQMLAVVLYQQERFGLLGCDQEPKAETCTNPGGIDGDRSGDAPLPQTVRAEHAAITQRAAEAGAVLFRNDRDTLPLDTADLDGGVAVSGPGADHLIAAPQKESATGFPDRNAISPLDQLRELVDDPSAFSFTPAGSPTGIALGPTELSTDADGTDPGLARSDGPGSPTTDPTLDFTTESTAGQLPSGSYRWDGFMHAKREDTVTFRLQVSAGVAPADVQLVVDGQPLSLSVATSPYCGQYYARRVCVPADTTASGLTEAGLINLEAPPRQVTAGGHRIEVRFANRGAEPASLRLAASKRQGDIDAAAADAKTKAVAIVFANDNGDIPEGEDDFADSTSTVSELPADQVALIRAVAAANPRTVVVLNTVAPVITTPWIDDPGVASVLQMWNAGSEGGTATARLLLGLASPGGRTPITWPRNATDTIWAYDQPTPLYPGDTPGPHPERLNGVDSPAAHCNIPAGSPHRCTKTVMSQGIFSGYRYHDQMGLAPQFPFGFGLTYTTFDYSDLRTRWDGDRLIVGVTISNRGDRRGTAAPQVYLGPVHPAPAGVQQSRRSLAGFDRVTLEPGSTKRIEIQVPKRSFQYWDERHQTWTTPRGNRSLFVGEPNLKSRLQLTTRVDIRSGRTG